jgi:hypothetical protein
MDFTIKLSFIVIIFLFGWLYQEQNHEWDIQRNLLKDANNISAHDAALQIDDDAKSRGRLIIDPLAARVTFEESLRLNLGLDSALDPRSGSPMRSGVRILHFEILDDSNSSFPVFYQNPTYGIAQWVYGPSVISVIETDHPRFVQRVFQQAPIRVPTVQEYKENRL